MMKAVTVALVLVFAGILYYGIVLSNPNRQETPYRELPPRPESIARDNMVGLTMLANMYFDVDNSIVKPIGLKELRDWSETERARETFGDLLTKHKDALYSGLEFEMAPSAIGKDLTFMEPDEPFLVFLTPQFGIHGMSKELKPLDAAGKKILRPFQ